MLVLPLPVMPKRSFVAVLTFLMRDRACFWSGLRGIFETAELLTLGSGAWRRDLAMPGGRIQLATAGRELR